MSIDGKISLSRTKAEDRPEYGTYGAINQLMGIPHNVRLDDLKQYSTEDAVHVNWYGPSAESVTHIMYCISVIILTNAGVHLVIIALRLTLLTGCIYLLSMPSIITVRVFRIPMQGDAYNNETVPSAITDDKMDRGEENFFESNAEFILMGDRQLTDNFRLGFNVGGNFMYQRSETLGVGVGNMVDKGNWMLNAANLLRTGSEDGYKQCHELSVRLCTDGMEGISVFGFDSS